MQSLPSIAWAHPLVAEWFLSRFGTPTEPQEQGWPHILVGRTTLISAPTAGTACSRPPPRMSTLRWTRMLVPPGERRGGSPVWRTTGRGRSAGAGVRCLSLGAAGSSGSPSESARWRPADAAHSRPSRHAGCWRRGTRQPCRCRPRPAHRGRTNQRRVGGRCPIDAPPLRPAKRKFPNDRIDPPVPSADELGRSLLPWLRRVVGAHGR